MKLFYIYSDTTGHDTIAVTFKEDYDKASKIGKKRLTRSRYRKGVRFEWTGARYVAETAEEALQEYWDE